MKPLHDRIIVRRIEEGEQRIGGIIIPDSAKEKPQQGKVIAVGAGKVKEDGKRIPLDVSVGDKVLYSKYGGTEIKVEGEDLLVLRESDVLARVDPREQRALVRTLRRHAPVRELPPDEVGQDVAAERRRVATEPHVAPQHPLRPRAVPVPAAATAQGAA